MKPFLATGIILICLLLYGCITPYDFAGTEGYRRLLVVEGIITDSITTVRLSRSVRLTERLSDNVYVDHATVFVECDEGTVSDASWLVGTGTYTVATGDLNPQQKYRLKIVLDGEEYLSEFLQPLITPDFELLLVREEEEARVSFQVSTQDTLNQSLYYLWSFKEDWEFRVRMRPDSICLDFEWVPYYTNTPDNIFYCWRKDSSHVFIMENTARFVRNEIKNKEIWSVFSDDERFSLLYHIAMKQNLIRKEAYVYYTNLQKNVERTGSIFSPIPAEMPGNLHCVTSPDLPVIGYIDVSTTTERKRFVRTEEVYTGDLMNMLYCSVDPPGGFIPPECYNTIRVQWAYYEGRRWFFNPVCVDCIAAGGTKDKPSWWPNDHQ